MKTIVEKTFHHDNLKASLCFDLAAEVYLIKIDRINTGETFDLHGIFLTEANARTVFDRIQL